MASLASLTLQPSETAVPYSSIELQRLPIGIGCQRLGKKCCVVIVIIIIDNNIIKKEGQ